MDKQSWSSRPWAVGLAAILAGAGAILSGSPLERSLFQWLHPLGAAAPTLWAYLSTLGLGLVMVLLLLCQISMLLRAQKYPRREIQSPRQ